ncbi:MAG: TIM barrel protein, partial [Pseudomonadota bacterium]
KTRIAEQLAFFMAAGAPCIVYGETARSVQGDRSIPLADKPKIDERTMADYGRKLSDFAGWCALEGMPIAYHHHMAAVVETEDELDMLMKHSDVPLLFDAGHMAFAGGDNFRVIENHHSRITHVHAKDIRSEVINGLDRAKESFLDAVVKGAFTVPGDGSLDFAAIAKALAAKSYEGWFVIEAEQDPIANPPLAMAKKGRAELSRVLNAAGYDVVSA